MSQTEPKLVCTLKTSLPIAGDDPIAWSEDNCIAVGTANHAFMYYLDPFDSVTDPNMHFKTQTLSLPSKLDYDCGVQVCMEEYDEQKKWQPHQAYAPDHDIYHSYLDISICPIEAKDLKSKGVKALGFSPIGCGSSGGTLFAILTMDHRLQIYSKKYDGTSIRWTESSDVSSALVTMLEKYNGFYPLRKIPQQKRPLKKAFWTKYAACINNFKWSSIATDEIIRKQYVYLVTSTKMNYLIVWELQIPFEETSNVKPIAFIKAFEEGAISCIVVYPTFKKGIEICVGNVNGKIVSITVDHQGNELSRRDLWKDDDELTVHCMDWQPLHNESDCSILVVAKAFAVIGLRMCGTQEPSCSVLKHVHALSVCSLVALESSVWIVAARDGSIGHVRYNSCSNSLTYDSLQQKNDSDAPTVREFLHSVVVSPNKTFLAALRSERVRFLSVMDDASSRVAIRTLTTGTKSFEVLCNQEISSPPGMDAVESVRLHLASEEISGDLSERDLLVGCVKHSVDSPTTRTTLKWCFAKIGQLIFELTKFQSVLRNLELDITIRQMVHVLKWLHQRESDVAWTKLPVLGIMKFLNTNRSILNSSQVEILELIEASGKFELQTAEICSVTGECLIFSDDGRRAITAITKIEWPRCCLTFRPLQGFHHFRCEISNTSSAEIDIDLQDIQHGRCLYSGLPMS